ncbi:MAG: LacI family DNA-binding transcriptional regulator [Chthoniobacterales bacterium]
MTLHDLARELNVSIATISRALSRPGDVAPHTRQRVLAAVHRHGYTPNGTKRALRTHQTRTIGVVVSDIRNTFFASVVKAVDDVARVNGYTVLICNADEDSAKEEAALQLLLDRKVSGVINCSTGANLELLRAFQHSGAVLVDLDRESGLDHVDTVVVDNERGAALAVEHLAKRNHRRIATIAGPQHLSNARGRLTGFRKTLHKYRISIDRRYLQFGDFRQDSGYDSAKKLLSREHRPTAIFSANIEMTAGLVAYVREAGIAIPQELSIVSFDDAFWTRYIDPPLTVIAQPMEDMGKCAMELLLARLRGGKLAQTQVFTPELIVRGSTAPLRDAEPIANRR